MTRDTGLGVRRFGGGALALVGGGWCAQSLGVRPTDFHRRCPSRFAAAEAVEPIRARILKSAPPATAVARETISRTRRVPSTHPSTADSRKMASTEPALGCGRWRAKSWSANPIINGGARTR